MRNFCEIGNAKKIMGKFRDKNLKAEIMHKNPKILSKNTIDLKDYDTKYIY